MNVDIYIIPGKKTAFLDRIRPHLDLVRKEDGCNMLQMFQDIDNENLICIWEVWRDKSAWDAHMVTDHSKSWHKDSSQFVDREEITVLDEL